MNNVPFLQVRNLTKHFGHLKALNEVSFDLSEGRSISIFGGNGAGKTTLIKILTTLMKPSSGSVSIGGHDLGKESGEIRESIGLISHSVFLYRDLNALENLRYYGRLYNVDNLDERIDSLLGRMGLQRRKFDPIRTYSRGMLQRLTIARAVIHNPTFLLLDEPFTGLDREAARELTGLVQELRGAGHTILLVTHNIERGMELADNLAVMAGGKMVWQGETSDVSPSDFHDIYSRFAVEDIG